MVAMMTQNLTFLLSANKIPIMNERGGWGRLWGWKTVSGPVPSICCLGSTPTPPAATLSPALLYPSPTAALVTAPLYPTAPRKGGMACS